MRFAQMLANRGRLDGVRMLLPSSVKLMTSNLLPAGVPLHFTQPFVGIGYGVNVGIVLDSSHADFNGGANGAGTFYWAACTEPGSGSIPPMTSSSLECSSNKTGGIR